MIGIFDSGLGGLTVLRAIRARLPTSEILYLADRAHVPYGDRAPAELRALLAANLAYLEAEGADVIAMGCNTSCAIAATYGWPPTRAPILDLIASAASAVAESGARRIGGLATAATVAAGAYGRAMRARDPALHVREFAAPKLVPLIERAAPDAEVRAAVASACAPLLGAIDALVYGCTHYPLVDGAFAAVLDDGVARIDPAVEQAAAAARLLVDRPETIDGTTSRHRRPTRFATTETDVAAFRGALARYVSLDVDTVVARAGLAAPRSGSPPVAQARLK